MINGLKNSIPQLSRKIDFYLQPLISYFNMSKKNPSNPVIEHLGKRDHEDLEDTAVEPPGTNAFKYQKAESNVNFGLLKHGKGRNVPNSILNRMSEADMKLLQAITTSCTDLERIKSAVQLRIKYNLSTRLPEDMEDSTYYVRDKLRCVYPYQYLYQAYAKRRWIGRKLKDVLKEEFRDISEEQLKSRFDLQRILVNGDPADYHHVLRDNDFVSNRNHRHELPVLATPIKIIYQDKETLVIDKPPSIPIHPCGRYRHNSVVNILAKEYNIKGIKVVHRLDRLVSGVLMLAFTSTRANFLEKSIKAREVQKEYVCRVAGEFPLGDPDDDGFITVDQPLETVPGKIGITVVLPNGKPSVTKFKRLSYNGKSSAVLCQPRTGRMHQIRVHLQYLGHPIINDGLYNCSSFGPNRGKGGNYGKSLQQLSADVLAKHRSTMWMIAEANDIIVPQQNSEVAEDIKLEHPTDQFVSEAESEETMAAISHYFTSESSMDLEKKWKYEQEKWVEDPTCRDCQFKYQDPPPRSLFLYLHALKYSGPSWSYESEMPIWAKDSWKF